MRNGSAGSIVSLAMVTVAQFLRYAAVGVLNAAIHFSILNFLSISFGVYSGVPIIFINATAAAVAIANSYLWNKYWTFRANGAVALELPKFVAVNAGGLILDTAIVYTLTTHVALPLATSPLLWENISKAVSLAVIVAWNFTGFKFFVFRKG